MKKQIEWEDVTSYDKLTEYSREVIGEDNCYDELFQDLMHGMIHNREQSKKQEKLNERISDMQGIILPNGK